MEPLLLALILSAWHERCLSGSNEVVQWGRLSTYSDKVDTYLWDNYSDTGPSYTRISTLF